MIIKLYLQGKEHSVAHIHVIYGECAGVIDVRTGKMLEGDLPSKALSMIEEWTLLHHPCRVALGDDSGGVLQTY